ncbi:hypothetical protein WDJ51_07640 [Rathayibacter sp. YIM 133350]|uniref:hypothetical protein n=1 Tax=Rathayibacter sp. YIM 133350 TaxID=3131992 RepID=UPI00307EEA12
MRPAPFFAVAAAAYTLNCALGASVALRVLDTREWRWVHHALYISTAATTALAVAAGVTGGPDGRRAAAALAPAAVPLAIIPYAGTRGLRHPLVALSAAPAFVLALILSRR